MAGSDSGGGAGIQADLRTFAFHCVHGTSAVTCVTAQNTLGVTGVDAWSAEAVAAQIEAVVGDIGVDGVKTGMLLNREIMAAGEFEFGEFGCGSGDGVMIGRSID